MVLSSNICSLLKKMKKKTWNHLVFLCLSTKLCSFRLNDEIEIDDDPPSNPQSDQILVTSSKDDVVVPMDDKRPVKLPRRLPPIPEDKLHRVSDSLDYCCNYSSTFSFRGIRMLYDKKLKTSKISFQKLP